MEVLTYEKKVALLSRSQKENKSECLYAARIALTSLEFEYVPYLLIPKE